MNGARAGFCCRGGAVGAMKTAEVNGVDTARVRRRLRL